MLAKSIKNLLSKSYAAYLYLLGYIIDRVPIFNKTKGVFLQYYEWSDLPSDLYKKVPPQLQKKYEEFMKFGKVKKCAFQIWKRYVEKDIGNGKRDGKVFWISASGMDKHLWNLAELESKKRGLFNDTFNHNYRLILESSGFKIILDKRFIPKDTKLATFQNVANCGVIGSTI